MSHPDDATFLLRDRNRHAKVTNEELFFDLIYAFAITQLSHRLLEHLTPLGAVQTLVLWFAVWLGWQYTCWVTNWFDPEKVRMRLMLFALMLIGLAMSATIPAAFAEAGLAFALCVAMWWVYFDTASEHGTHAIMQSDDPGRIGAWFHYIHVTLIAGIIVAAVGDELMIHHPDHHIDAAAACVLVGGPLLYLIGNAAYKKVVYGSFPPSHLFGIAALAVLFSAAFVTDRLMVGGLATLTLIIVAVWQTRRAPGAPGKRH